MNLEELSQRVINLENQVKSQIVSFVPSGVNFKLSSKNSIDPGHQHVLPSDDRINVYTQFESTSGWSTGGVGTELIAFNVGSAALITGANTNDDAFAVINSAFNTFIPAKKSVMQTIVRFGSTTSQLVYFGVGDIVQMAAGTEQGYGFKVVNGTLSALSTKSTGGVSTEQLTTISGITLTNFNTYRAVLSTGRVDFYINGLQVAFHTTQVPDDDSAVMYSYYIKTTTTASRRLDLKYMFFSQDN